MKKCDKCTRTYFGHPFSWHGGNEMFCSADCLPEGIYDEPLALQYIGLLETYRSITESPQPTSLNELEEIVGELDYLISQLEEYALGDIDGLYYKAAMRELHERVVITEEEFKAYFMKKEHFRIDFGFHIFWEMIRMEESEEVAFGLQSFLQSVLDKHDDTPTILYNQEIEALQESQNIIYFDDGGSFADDGMHPIIEELYDSAHEYLTPLIKTEFNDFCSYVELAECPKCGMMEPWEDFLYKEKDNILVCWSC